MGSEEQSDGEDQWRRDIGVDTPKIDAVACTSAGFGHDNRSSNRGPTRVHAVHYQHPWSHLPEQEGLWCCVEL